MVSKNTTKQTTKLEYKAWSNRLVRVRVHHPAESIQLSLRLALPGSPLSLSTPKLSYSNINHVNSEEQPKNWKKDKKTKIIGEVGVAAARVFKWRAL